MPLPVKLLALRPGSAGPGWQEWHVDFRLMGLSGPAHEPVMVTVRPVLLWTVRTRRSRKGGCSWPALPLTLPWWPRRTHVEPRPEKRT
jgi:hypothetical protein